MSKSPNKLFKPLGNHINGFAKVKVVGVGGGGSNAVSRMSRDFLRGVEFIAINTDAQDLDFSPVKRKIYIGNNLTKGLGTGMNPDLGKQAAEENRSEIADAVSGSDLVFVTAGMGGGTGTGGAPIIAEVAKQAGALTIAVVTKPFSFEGSQRSRVAQEGLLKLKDKVDALIVIPNDKIFSIINQDTSIMKAFEAIDEVLKNAVQGIVELISTPGIINLDFADVRVVMQDAGSAIVGLGVAQGKERAINAVTQAVSSPLLEVTIDGAKGILLGIAGTRDMKMNEVNEIAKAVSEAVDPSAKIIFGAYHDRKLKNGQLKVTLIATGFNGTKPANSLFGGFQEKEAPNFGGFVDEEIKEMHVNTARFAAAKQEDVESKPSVITARGKKEAKEEEDPWNIPAFMRRKKK